MYNNKVYSLNRNNDTPMKLEELRRLLPTDSNSALTCLDHLKTMVDSEAIYRDKVVDIDVSEGTYVKAITFQSPEELTLVFNEGTVKVVDQTDGVYSIAEHIYDFSTNCLNDKKIKSTAHNTALARLTEQPCHLIPNETWIEVFYNHFPAARSFQPDALYNINDVTNTCRRIEHFRTYLLQALHDAFATITDAPGMAICLIDTSHKSRLVYEDLILAINNDRRYPLSLCETEDGPISSFNYVYYMRDPLVFPSNFDHNIAIAPGAKRYSADEQFDKALAFDKKFISRSSSLLVGSYKPILDVYSRQDGSLYSAQLYDYEYSQFYYVPHKPWVLINVAAKDDMYLLKAFDSTDKPVSNRFRYRLLVFRCMSAINVNRNVAMADDQSLASMRPAEEVLPGLIGELDLNQIFLSRYMRATVRLMSKRLAYRDVSVETVVKIPCLMNDLKVKVDYTQDHLKTLGWDSQTIARALELELLTITKNSSLIIYRKYIPSEKNYKRHLTRRPLDSLSTASVINSDGSVSALDDGPDEKSYVLPFMGVAHDRPFKDNVPYDDVMFKGPPVPDKETSAFKYVNDSCLEFNEDISLRHPRPLDKNRSQKKYKRVGKRKKVKNFRKKAKRPKPPNISPILVTEESSSKGDPPDFEAAYARVAPSFFDNDQERKVFQSSVEYCRSLGLPPPAWEASGELLFTF